MLKEPREKEEGRNFNSQGGSIFSPNGGGGGTKGWPCIEFYCYYIWI